MPEFRNTARIHANTGDDTHVSVFGDRVDATLTLEDGRCVQVGLLNDGRVTVRAWAAEPYATNNLTAAQVAFTLPTLEDMVLDGKEVTAFSFASSTITEKSLAQPEEHDGTWYYANQKIRDRVEGIKTLLGLRTNRDTPDRA